MGRQRRPGVNDTRVSTTPEREHIRVAKPPKKETFTTRLPPHTAKFVRGLAKSKKVLVSTIISELVDEAIQARVKNLLPAAADSRPSPPQPKATSTPKAPPGNPHGTLRNQAEATELILKEIRRRGGHPDLEARLEQSIRDFWERKKRRGPRTADFKFNIALGKTECHPAGPRAGGEISGAARSRFRSPPPRESRKSLAG